jgi:hypothetical protein
MVGSAGIGCGIGAGGMRLTSGFDGVVGAVDFAGEVAVAGDGAGVG